MDTLNPASELVYPYPGGVPHDAATELHEGIFWMNLPLPFAMGQINVWLLADGDGWTLVDTAPAVPECKAAWETLLGAHLRGRQIRRIIVTHYHPDHVGLARWLANRFSCEVWMSAETRDKVAFLLGDGKAPLETAMSGFYRRHGVGDPRLHVEFESGGKYCRVVSGNPDRVRIMDEGETFAIGARTWRVILCNGHARGHAALYCEGSGILISGDQILPKITCNISLMSLEAESNPLAEYYASLERLRQLPEATLVLPSHGRVFRGLHARIRQIEHDHAERLAEIEAFCSEPRHADAISRLLFPQQLNDLNRVLAFGETLAHVRYLEREGRVRSAISNGHIVYSRA